jgi:hypothetical protein
VAAESERSGPERPRSRRRRDHDRDEIFGDILPATTSDERDPEPPDSDDWYEHNRPPHHGV